MGEFNQCQMQLVDLYKESARGGHEAEFSAYRLLFTVVQKRHYGILVLLIFITTSDITRTMREIPFALEKDPAVQHAIAVQSAVILNDYIQFFRFAHMFSAFVNVSGCGLKCLTWECIC